MGFTWENDLQFALKRAKAGELLLGGAAEHRAHDRRGVTVQLTFDPDVEAFRAEFVAFLDEHLPHRDAGRPTLRSSAHMPQWARRLAAAAVRQRLAAARQPPEFGGRNATVLQQYVHLEELSPAADLPQLQPAGPRHHRGLAAHVRHRRSRSSGGRCRSCGPRSPPSLGMSEPGAGSDLAVAAHPGRRWTATTSSSTGRRCGRRARTTPTCC